MIVLLMHDCPAKLKEPLLTGCTGRLASISTGVINKAEGGICWVAGLLLYLLDVTFRMAQQVQPVKVSRVQACRSATLATLEFNTDPHTTIKPVQVCSRSCSGACVCLYISGASCMLPICKVVSFCLSVMRCSSQAKVTGSLIRAAASSCEFCRQD